MKSKNRKSKAGNISLKGRGKRQRRLDQNPRFLTRRCREMPVRADRECLELTMASGLKGRYIRVKIITAGLREFTVGVFQSTPEGQFLNVNQAMAHIYGFRSPDAMLASIKDIATQIHVDPATRKEFERLLSEQGNVSEFINLNRRKDGSIIWTSTCAAP